MLLADVVVLPLTCLVAGAIDRCLALLVEQVWSRPGLAILKPIVFESSFSL